MHRKTFSYKFGRWHRNHRNVRDRVILIHSIALLIAAPLASAQVNDSAKRTGGPDQKDTIVMPEFRLNESPDQGFGAEYTSGGTRITAEIKKSPITVIVFNQEFRQTVG